MRIKKIVGDPFQFFKRIITVLLFFSLLSVIKGEKYANLDINETREAIVGQFIEIFEEYAGKTNLSVCKECPIRDTSETCSSSSQEQTPESQRECIEKYLERFVKEVHDEIDEKYKKKLIGP